MANWQGKKIIVVGAARQGLAATRFLAGQGAHIILTDSRSEQLFISKISSFSGMNVEFIFGSHPLSILEGANCVCISGGVPLEIPLVKKAKEMGIQLTNDAQIFLDIVKAPVIGITGSAGKTTTTTLIGEIAKAATSSTQNIWVGGNIGNPLIDHIEEIKPSDWVVMELSSFQLELMQKSPDIALVLNITPNHLDRHKTMKAYTDAKSNILRNQHTGSIAILNRDDAGSIDLKKLVFNKLITFGMEKPTQGFIGTFIEDGWLKYLGKESISPIMPIDEIKLPGKHNQMNALAACTAGIAAGFSSIAIRRGISSVNGIPHRLELVRKHKGVRWYNDSIATAPERVIAALEAIPGSLVLLLGGRDKDLPWKELALNISERNLKVVVFGEAGEMIEAVLRAENMINQTSPISRFEKMEDAVIQASEIAQDGDAVLLSPGGTSYDAFLDFEERGNLFREIVEALE